MARIAGPPGAAAIGIAFPGQVGLIGVRNVRPQARNEEWVEKGVTDPIAVGGGAVRRARPVVALAQAADAVAAPRNRDREWDASTHGGDLPGRGESPAPR